MARIEMFTGDTETLTVYVTCNQIPVIITDATIKFTVKTQSDDADFIMQKTTDDISEIEITDGAGGIFKIYLIEADTLNLAPGFYPYDIEITFINGVIKTIMREFLVISEDITP